MPARLGQSWYQNTSIRERLPGWEGRQDGRPREAAETGRVNATPRAVKPEQEESSADATLKLLLAKQGALARTTPKACSTPNLP